MVNAIVQSLEGAFRGAAFAAEPYPHWHPTGLLPEKVARAVCDLPFVPPHIDDTQGRRETHNALRCFFDVENRHQYTVCDDVARAYASPELLDCIEKAFDCDLRGTYLRIEHCLDTGPFWLAPHTDLGVKKFTLFHYLSEHDDAALWGTDVYAAADRWHSRASGAFNSALVFVPSDHTWHGFERRSMHGVRRSLIINYVTEKWRNRHELAFPDPVR